MATVLVIVNGQQPLSSKETALILQSIPGAVIVVDQAFGRSDSELLKRVFAGELLNTALMILEPLEIPSNCRLPLKKIELPLVKHHEYIVSRGKFRNR